MKINVTQLITVAILVASPFQIADGAIHWDDGQKHVIGYEIRDNIILGSFDYPDLGTNVTIQDDGVVYKMYTYGISSVDIVGGIVYHDIHAEQGSTVSVSGGVVGGLSAYHLATIEVSGGIVSDLDIFTYSQAVISGGYIHEISVRGDSPSAIINGGSFSELEVGGNGMVYLDGDFKVNGTPVEIGANLRDYATFEVGTNYNYYSGVLTGLLADGTSLNSTFNILESQSSSNFYKNGTIIIIPEPSSLLLLGLGGLLLRRKNS